MMEAVDILSAEDELFSRLVTQIGGVPSERIADVWERVKPILERVVTPDTGYSLDDVMLELHDATAQLWIIEDFQAVVVTKILDRPTHRAFWVWFAAGDDVASWIDDFTELAEVFAKHMGCRYVEFSGRKGWAKFCKPNGYRVVLTTFRKDLNNG